MTNDQVAKLNKSQRSAMKTLFPGGVDNLSVTIFPAFVKIEATADHACYLTYLGKRGALRSHSVVGGCKCAACTINH